MKRNVVAAIKSGISQLSISRRFGIPATTVLQWRKNPKYADVQPAGQNILEALPPDPSHFAITYRSEREEHFVQVPKVAEAPTPRQGHRMKVSFGKLEFESDSFTPEDIRTVIKALVDAHVL